MGVLLGAQAPIGPAPTGPLPAPEGSAPGAPAAPGTAPAAPAPLWLPRETALLQVLDKINARSLDLAVKVGETVPFEHLAITVRACFVRPPTLAEDAAADLRIVDSRPDAPGFAGWMFAAEPSLAMLQHPLYDVRVRGCR